MSYTDELVRAIRRRFAPDFATALRDSDDPMGFKNPVNSVTVPLRADVRVLYDRDLAAFVIRGRAHDSGKDQFQHWEAVFGSETLARACDRAGAVEYLFDKVKHEFLRSLADGELDQILEKRKS